MEKEKVKKEEKILISACLAGINCKYNGGNNLNEKIVELVKEGKAILVCPEQLGGLPTPRVPSEIVISSSAKRNHIKINTEDSISNTELYNENSKDVYGVNVVNKEGLDVTKQFCRGAEETLKIAKQYNIKKAILKSRSPSCGYGEIYDGTFSGSLIEGNGITTNLLLQNGIEVISSDGIAIDKV